MITLDAIRAAVLSDKPWSKLDDLVRAELAAGRKVKEILASINPLVDTVLETPGLTEDGEEALLDTLDALNGNCRSDQCYRNPPVLPSEEEIAALPRWARVALVVRSVRREFPLYRHLWSTGNEQYIQLERRTLDVAEQSAATAADRVSALKRVSYGTVFADMPLEVVAIAHHLAEAALCVLSPTVVAGRIHQVLLGVQDTASSIADLTAIVRRDFDHLANLAEWQHWTDDTPVPPEVFGPLWPEGPPPGWPADPDVPQRTDLPLELLSRARVLERMTEDEAVNLFNAINAYYIARTGHRLTLEDLRPSLPAAVPAEV